MRKFLMAFAFLASNATAYGQEVGEPFFGNHPPGVTPITVEASCTGTGSAAPTPCSTAMTVTAGDTIACVASGSFFDPVSLAFNDPVNGYYDNVVGLPHPNAATTTWVATAVFYNSAGGSITPQVNNWEPATLNIECQALKGTPASQVLDGGSVNQTNSQGTAAANPTSGTAAAPTNNNEVVFGTMVRPATATVSSGGSPWVPSGTITAVGSTYPVYGQYQIQRTSTAVNSPMTANSAKFVDTQFAVLNAASAGGYRSLTGFYGAPAIAKTNGTTVTASDLSGATTTLTSLNMSGSPIWTITGTAPTYNTSVAPSGTRKVMTDGVPHTIGDAGTSLDFTGAPTRDIQIFDDYANAGTPMWFSFFFRVASSGTSSGQECDSVEFGNGVTETNQTLQSEYDSTNGLYFKYESFDGGASPFLLGLGLTLDTDYWIQMHIAGVNERNHQFLVYGKSGGTWSLLGTQNYDVLCATYVIVPCAVGATVATPTGTASNASTALTVSSGTGTVNGQGVVDPVGGCLPPGDTISTGGGTTSITLSVATTCAISGTQINFYTYPSPIVVIPTGSASSGSTSLTISSGTATANGQLVLDPTNNCIPYPTLVESGGGTTSITLSQKTTCALSASNSLPVQFFKAPTTLLVATNGTASAASTALTVVAPGTGTIAAGQPVGGAGIVPGTTVSSVSGTSVTLSQPTSAALSSSGVSFWHTSGGGANLTIGKWSSCSMGGDQFYSGMFYDPFGTWGPFAPN